MKIRDVKVMLLTAKVPPERQYASDFGRVTSRSAAIVRIDTDEGITGYGEAKGTPLVMKSIIEHELKPQVIGEDPTKVTYLWEKMYNGSRLGLSLYYGRSQPTSTAPGELMCAISGVDVALWDILGKSLNVPIYKLIGGAVRDRIKAYASAGHGKVGRIGQEFAGYVAKGYKACKMRVGGMDHPHMVAGSRARVKEARETVGPDIDIMLDAHGSTGITDAIKLAKAVEEFNITWYEEPAIYHNIKGLAEVRQSINIPVATGENLYTRFGFRDLADARAADIWQPDTAMAGGITEMLRIAAMASANEAQLAPHVWGTAILWAASLQLAAALPNYYYFEFSQTYSPLLTELISVPVQVDKDGNVPVPDGPGLGVEVDPEAEKHFPFEESASEYAPAT
ncbi:MAG: mandelate racemase/muconate lactonizing enzyme family protein [Bacteroidetes bacterium]|nr:mandelate racemase/muconate lactonizing enzyme family protein [Bacteroidota bacterium]MCL5026696.1 mandelate racemase/muconate lactonizing enzyme family protein [Chloroflexota bacterium]